MGATDPEKLRKILAQMTELVGRDRELAWVRDRLAAPEGSAVLVSGEAGVGKSRLVNEGLASADALLRITFPGARFAAPGLGLRRLLELGGPEAAALEQELAGPEAIGAWKLASICRATDALLRARAPGVLALDDLQWADELTLAWLSQSADLLEAAPLRLVLVVRAAGELPVRVASAIAPLQRRGRLVSLSLQPLDADGVAALASSLGYRAGGSVAQRLLDRSDGLPLAVEEIVRMLLERGRLPSAETDLAEVGVPGVVAAVVNEELEALPEDARRLLAATALAPQPASGALVRAAAGLSVEAFDLALERALRSGLLRDGASGVLSFRHDLQREAVQRALPLARRRAMHRAIAGLLASGPDPRPGQVAAQLIEAGDAEDALAWLERAAAAAAASHDHGGALAHLSAAVELSGPGDHLIRLAEKTVLAARNTGREEDGRRILEEALSRADTPRQRGWVLLGRARLEMLAGDFAGRVETLREARGQFLSAGDDAGHATTLGHLALPSDGMLPVEERIRLGWEGLRLARTAGSAAAVSRCAGNLAAAEIWQGNERAFDLWREATRAVTGDSGAEGADEYLRNITNWAIGAISYGLFAEAGETIESGLGGAERWGAPHWEAPLRTLQAIRLWRVGRWDEALENARRGGSARGPDGALLAAVGVAVAFEREPRPDVGRLAQAYSTLVRFEAYDWAAVALAVLIRARQARREPRPGRGLREAAEVVMAAGVRIGWEDLFPAAARLGPEAYRRLLAIAGDLRPAGRRGEAAVLLAAGLARTDRRREDLLMDAAGAFDAIGEPSSRAEALAEAALARAGRGLRAGDLAAEAAAIYRDLGAKRSLASFLRRAPRARALEPFRAESEEPSPSPWRLTQREREIAELARLGYTAAEVASELGISKRTVEKHLERVKGKLGVARKSELVRLLADDAPR